MPQIKPLADSVNSKYSFTYLLTYLRCSLVLLVITCSALDQTNENVGELAQSIQSICDENEPQT